MALPTDAEDNTPSYLGNAEDFDKRAADHEVLLDLRVLNPRRMLSPLRNEVLRNQRSGATLALIASFQRFSRAADAFD
jgi:hypothetical protein